MTTFVSLPKSWSDLTWQQLCKVWQTKMRYGGNPDVARAAALLELLGCEVCRHHDMPSLCYDDKTGERQYTLRSEDGKLFFATPRELSQLAKKALPWFDWPYGDTGEKEVRDEKGKVVKEEREGVRGYVSPMHDALILPEETVDVEQWCFALPQLACSNITWQQYRALQAIASQLLADGITEEQALDLQAQFLAHCLVPAQEGEQSGDKFQPKHKFIYNAERAEQSVGFWKERLTACRNNDITSLRQNEKAIVPILFHICFQAYHTAILYYEKVYPLLFTGSDKSDTMRDALTGEVGTINSVMKYQGYSDPQQVYDANLPIILDALNTMTKEAKEIERMNSKIKK